MKGERVWSAAYEESEGWNFGILHLGTWEIGRPGVIPLADPDLDLGDPGVSTVDRSTPVPFRA
jgi:hypothetical protein